VIVLDTSVVYALADEADVRHHETVGWYEEQLPEMVTTPLVLTEADHLIGSRLGRRALDGWWADVAAGAYGSIGGRRRRGGSARSRSSGPTSGSGSRTRH
jgi:predicted nucleic acid-binding protein